MKIIDFILGKQKRIFPHLKFAQVSEAMKEPLDQRSQEQIKSPEEVRKKNHCGRSLLTENYFVFFYVVMVAILKFTQHYPVADLN